MARLLASDAGTSGTMMSKPRFSERPAQNEKRPAWQGGSLLDASYRIGNCWVTDTRSGFSIGRYTRNDTCRNGDGLCPSAGRQCRPPGRESRKGSEMRKQKAERIRAALLRVVHMVAFAIIVGSVKWGLDQLIPMIFG